MKNASPYLLSPTGKDYLWGGRRLNEALTKNLPLEPLAETWECSTHPDGESYIVGGQWDGMPLSSLLLAHPEYLGSRRAEPGQLPILVKFLDAAMDLSIQVHPTDGYAAQHENGQLGKSEMWYVLDAAPDAELIYGLRRDMTPQELRRELEQGNILHCLQRIPVKKDDVFFVEAGTIHAVGKGILLAEIQESSNLTYRLYDYDRRDSFGKLRPLHTEKALAAANLQASARPRQPMRVLHYHPGMASEHLCRCKYFSVYRLLVNTEHRQQVHCTTDGSAYRVLLCIGGCGTMECGDTCRHIYKGDCVFVPANCMDIQLHGQMQFLDIRG